MLKLHEVVENGKILVSSDTLTLIGKGFCHFAPAALLGVMVGGGCGLVVNKLPCLLKPVGSLAAGLLLPYVACKFEAWREANNIGLYADIRAEAQARMDEAAAQFDVTAEQLRNNELHLLGADN